MLKVSVGGNVPRVLRGHKLHISRALTHIISLGWQAWKEVMFVVLPGSESVKAKVKEVSWLEGTGTTGDI